MKEVALVVRNSKAVRKGFRQFLKHGKMPATLTVFYQRFRAGFSIFCILFSVTQLTNFKCSQREISHAIYVVANTFATLSFLYFIQLSKRAGHLLILLLKMMYDAATFLLVAGVFFVAATNFYYGMAHTGFSCEELAESNNTYVVDYVETAFETFLLVLAVKSPSTEIGDRLWGHEISHGIYILSVVFFTIILLNMLIGIMTKRITDIQEHKDTLLKLEKLSVIFCEEKMMRTTFIFRLGVVQRYFKVSKDLHRVYVPVTEKV